MHVLKNVHCVDLKYRTVLEVLHWAAWWAHSPTVKALARIPRSLSVCPSPQHLQGHTGPLEESEQQLALGFKNTHERFKSLAAQPSGMEMGMGVGMDGSSLALSVFRSQVMVSFGAPAENREPASMTPRGMSQDVPGGAPKDPSRRGGSQDADASRGVPKAPFSTGIPREREAFRGGLNEREPLRRGPKHPSVQGPRPLSRSARRDPPKDPLVKGPRGPSRSAACTASLSLRVHALKAEPDPVPQTHCEEKGQLFGQVENGQAENGQAGRGSGSGTASKRKQMGLSGARGLLPRSAAATMLQWLLSHWDTP